jgi:hypothetical protein
MPRARRARDKRSRARKPQRRAAPKLTSLLLDMEEPLTDAINYVHALHIVGKGLILDHDNGGEPIMAIAWMAAKRLEVVRAMWNRVRAENRRQRS